MISIGLALSTLVGNRAPAGTAEDFAPVFIAAPAIEEVARTAETVSYRLSEGSAAGRPAPTLTGAATLDGADVTADIAGGLLEVPRGGAPRTLIWSVTARNGLSPDAVQNAEVAVPAGDVAVPDELALNDFSRDRTIFDGGLAIGQSAATVPLSGQAAPGEAIEARAVGEDGSTTAWKQIATAGVDGLWQGAIEAPVATHWFRAEARLRSAPGDVLATANRFGVGLIVSFHEQSNLAQLLLNFYDAPELSVPVPDPEAVQWIELDNRGKPGEPDTGTPGPFQRITDTSGHTTSLKHMAAQISEAAPGLKVLMVMDHKAGVHQNATLDDRDPERSFAAVKALFDKVRADGAEIGLMVQSHTNQINGADYAEYLSRSVIGRRMDGRPAPTDLDARFVFDGGAYSKKGDHIWAEVLPGLLTGRTKVVVADSGYGWPSGVNSENDDFHRAALDLAANPAFAPNPFVAGLRHNNIRIGKMDDPLSDSSHFTADSVWGKPNSARQRIVTAFAAAGIIDIPEPVFDRITWTPDYVELGSSAGPVTTIALQQGLPELDKTDHPDFTRALGFRFSDTEQARQVEIVDPETGLPAREGVVRVYPNDGQPFDGFSRLFFRRYSGAGQFQFNTYFLNDAYLHKPVVMAGPEGFRAIEVQPFYDPGAITAANTLPSGTDESFYTLDGATKFDGPWLSDTGTLTVETKIRYLPGNGVGNILYGGTNFYIYMLPDENLFHVMTRRADGTVAFSERTAANFNDMEGLHTVRVVYDFPQRMVRLFYDDVEYVDAKFGTPGAVNGGPASTIRGNNTILLARQQADIAYFRMWKSAEPDGGTPGEAPWVEILAQPGNTFTTINAEKVALA